MRHPACVVELLVVLVLGWSVLAEAAEALAVVLNRHVHSILHIQLVLVLLQLTLVPNVMRPAGPRVDRGESVRHRHHLRLVTALVHGAIPVVIVVCSCVLVGGHRGTASSNFPLLRRASTLLNASGSASESFGRVAIRGISGLHRLIVVLSAVVRS